MDCFALLWTKDFGRATQNVSFDYQYVAYCEEIHEENELIHLGKVSEIDLKKVYFFH